MALSSILVQTIVLLKWDRERRRDERPYRFYRKHRLFGVRVAYFLSDIALLVCLVGIAFVR